MCCKQFFVCGGDDDLSSILIEEYAGALAAFLVTMYFYLETMSSLFSLEAANCCEAQRTLLLVVNI